MRQTGAPTGSDSKDSRERCQTKTHTYRQNWSTQESRPQLVSPMKIVLLLLRLFLYQLPSLSRRTVPFAALSSVFMWGFRPESM